MGGIILTAIESMNKDLNDMAQEPSTLDSHNSGPQSPLMEFSPIPSSKSLSLYTASLPLLPLLNDQKATMRLLAFMLKQSGRSIGEIARSMGVNKASMQQYLHGRRQKIGLDVFLRFVTACGMKVHLQLK